MEKEPKPDKQNLFPNLKILVAEDEQIQRELLFVTLTTELDINHQKIHFCQDGAEACTAIL